MRRAGMVSSYVLNSLWVVSGYNQSLAIYLYTLSAKHKAYFWHVNQLWTLKKNCQLTTSKANNITPQLHTSAFLPSYFSPCNINESIIFSSPEGVLFFILTNGAEIKRPCTWSYNWPQCINSHVKYIMWNSTKNKDDVWKLEGTHELQNYTMCLHTAADFRKTFQYWKTHKNIFW